MARKDDNKHLETQGNVTGGKWMGRVIKASKDLAYGLGLGAGAAAAGGQMAVEGLMEVMHKLSEGAVSSAQQLGSMISKSAGAAVQQLEKLDQKPFADNDAPSLAGALSNAFKAGAADGDKKIRSLRRQKGSAKSKFKTA